MDVTALIVMIKQFTNIFWKSLPEQQPFVREWFYLNCETDTNK